MINLRSQLYSAFYDHDPVPITAFVRWLAIAYGVADPPRILDIGCGPGRMLREFAPLGWSVVGLEPDPDYAAQAAAVAYPFANATVQQGGFADLRSVTEVGWRG